MLFSEQLLLHNFKTTVPFSELLFVQSSCFFEELRFQNNHVLAAVIFSEYKLFRSETSTKQPLFENRKFSVGQLLLGTATFLAEELFRVKSSFFKAGASAQHQLFQESYVFRKANFSENILHYLLCLESYLSRVTTFPKNIIFYRRCLFRKATFIFLQVYFLSTATFTIFQLVIK